MTDFAALLKPDQGQPARTIHVVHPDDWQDWLSAQPPRVRTAVAANGLTGKAGNAAILPGEGAEDWSALLVCNEDAGSPWRIASRAAALPEGIYRLANGEPGAAMLGWLLAQHRFERYRKVDAGGPRVLLTSEPGRIDEAVRMAEAVARVRDLVDTPAADLGPANLEIVVRALGEQHGATVTVTAGRELETGYPMIHAVGLAAAKGREPRLIELDPHFPSKALISLS